MKHHIQKTESLFGLELSNDFLENISQYLIQRAVENKKTQLSFINAHCLNLARKNKRYYQSLKTSEILLPDGSGVNLALKLKGKKLINNLNGTDLFPILCQQAAQKKLSLFLLGARPGIAEKTAENIKKQIPDLIIAGTQDGYFKTEETKTIIANINASRADIVLIAFGVPKQELFITEHKAEFKAGLILGVGGLFDFFSNRIPRAPLWLRKTGMEWIYRFIQEPKRMWKRYLLGNPLFVMHAVFHALSYWIQKSIRLNRNKSRK